MFFIRCSGHSVSLVVLNVGSVVLADDCRHCLRPAPALSLVFVLVELLVVLFLLAHARVASGVGHVALA